MAGKETKLRRAFKDDVVAAYHGCLRAHKRSDVAFEQLAKAPAPRFYVDFELARRMVSLIEKGRPLPVKNRNKIAMFEELHRRWKKRGAASFEPLREIINEPAPCFYRDCETMKRVVYRRMRAKRT